VYNDFLSAVEALGNGFLEKLPLAGFQFLVVVQLIIHHVRMIANLLEEVEPSYRYDIFFSNLS